MLWKFDFVVRQTGATWTALSSGSVLYLQVLLEVRGLPSDEPIRTMGMEQSSFTVVHALAALAFGILFPGMAWSARTLEDVTPGDDRLGIA